MSSGTGTATVAALLDEQQYRDIFKLIDEEDVEKLKEFLKVSSYEKFLLKNEHNQTALHYAIRRGSIKKS